MINKNNFRQLLQKLGFTEEHSVAYVFSKKIEDCYLKADFTHETLIYPDALKAHRETTKNFSQNENFVVFECVHRLLMQGYNPAHIELEKPMPGGHGDTGGYCDIIIKDNYEKPYLLIECKNSGERILRCMAKNGNKWWAVV